MNNSVEDHILKTIGCSKAYAVEKIQDLWSGYGSIERYRLEGFESETLIVKHVRIPDKKNHPRGWNTNKSHQRKLKSYHVESAWYEKWSGSCSKSCYVPHCYSTESSEEEFLFILEDLDASAFPKRMSSVGLTEIRACLKWLAHFHATFMGKTPESLWSTGTYWHLDTRPDELQALKDRELKDAASVIDQKLKDCQYQTFVHGDAKLANFCFSDDGKKVAAVDFQYVGGGCGMKDVAYFIGSCLDETHCEKYETELLDYYFSVLSNVVKAKGFDSDVNSLVETWRSLYPVAWADFHRFLKGWSPEHWKLNSYSEKTTRNVIAGLR